MRTYRQVEGFEEKVAAYLAKHADRLIGQEPPRGLWVCEEDGEVVIALTVYTSPHLRISAIIDKPETKPFASLTHLADAFEAWAVGQGVTHYCVVIDKFDDHYCKIIERHGGVVLRESGQWVEYLHEIDQSPKTEDAIRPWKPSDWKALRPLVTAFLKEHYAAGGDFRPTRHNVEAFIRKGVKASALSDPTLLAYAGGKLVGFVLWAGVPESGLELRDRICLGIGTYVVPEVRRQGWSVKLRRAATTLARVAGYTRVDGVALDERGFKAGQAVGGRSVGLVVRLAIEKE
jgi:GNAT superfamily N-acetyltransferase